MFTDTHAHYDDKQFDDDRHSLIMQLNKNGIDRIVNIGSTIASSRFSVELAHRYDFVWAAVGVHPEECADMTDADIYALRALCADDRVVAVGEIGLDYHYADVSPKCNQWVWFIKQLKLAAQLDLPVVIHSREAAQDTFDIIKQSSVRKGVIHAFSGSAEMAEEYVKMGFYIGVGGVVTFKNGKSLVKTVERIPLDKIVLETDSPYLSPEPNRGRRNDSGNLKYVAAKIADIKGVDIGCVADITTKNAAVLYNIQA